MTRRKTQKSIADEEILTMEELPGRVPDPESRRGMGIEFTKTMADDFLFLSTNEKVIATARKACKNST